ncbi:MAG: hypothetical protein CVU03_08505 [Bacteroidetes bacterium HGW-Bacteroidetes-2]|nr:MAG: hypothetical protein CVU03_08505 [Bacteroidetes bacterium HGW-Bacteroidetes-2]
MSNIVFLHDTSLSTPRGAELTIKELIKLGEKKGHTIVLDYLSNFNTTKMLVSAADVIVVNSMSRCAYELEVIHYLLKQNIPYIKVEYDYNFCIRRNILCTVDRKIKSCCDADKFHLFRDLFAKAALTIFQSPEHYKSHYNFYGEAVANHLIMPPTVDVDALQISALKIEGVIPFFGDLNFLKGGHEFITYAEEHPEIHFKVYGSNRLRREIPANISFFEPVSNAKVLHILGQTKQFFCKPVWPEPSGRLAAEAFLSGCELIANERVGTFSFDFYPEHKEKAKREMKQAPENFWKAIETLLNSAKKPKIATLGNVLVYKSYGGLGDIFFAIPAIYKLAKVSRNLHFAVAPRLVPFFTKHLTGVKVVNEAEVRLQEKKYNAVYELGNYPAFRGYDLPHALKYPTHKKVKQHAIQHYIDTVAKLHVDIDNHLDAYPYFKRNPNPSKKYFVIHHGAGFLLKIWPTEKYAQLIENIHTLFPTLDCKIIQGPDDPDISKFFSKKWEHVEYITGGMEEVGEAMAGAIFHIGNDAGITHVAGSFNVPTVGIYGPTGPGSWGSFAQYNELIWGKKGVCNLHCNYDVILSCAHRICLTSVTINRVLEALYKVLQKAYIEEDYCLRPNPQLQLDFSEKDCLITFSDGELLLEFHNKTMKKQIENLLTKETLSLPDESEIHQVISVLKQQHILFEVPLFKN